MKIPYITEEVNKNVMSLKAKMGEGEGDRRKEALCIGEVPVSVPESKF